ncbi:MAG TPA: HprK-related kinase A [Burkholderiales bacterium]|nr:HprK-related kinase A [Burkholderiales bacterium]
MLVGELSRAELAHRLRGDGVHLCTGAFTTHLVIELPGLVEEFGEMYGGYPIEAPPQIDDFRVRVAAPSLLRRYVRPQAQVWVDGASLIEPLAREHAYPGLESSLNLGVATLDVAPLLLHAAVLERDGRALVMPAPSGSGKSTLCAALAWRGWRLLSDEMAVFSFESGRLLPNPRPISLKNEALRTISDFEPRARFSRLYRGTNKGDVAYMAPPPNALAGLHEEAGPGQVIAPVYRSGSPTVLRRVEKAAAFRWLVDNSVNYASLLRTGYDLLTGFIEACDLYSLTYSSLNEAIELIGRLHEREAATA